MMTHEVSSLWTADGIAAMLIMSVVMALLMSVIMYYILRCRCTYCAEGRNRKNP